MEKEASQILAKLFELRKKIEFSLPKHNVAIKTSREIAARTRLSVSTEGMGTYTSLVVENTGRYMAFSYPEGPAVPEGFD